MLTNLTSYLPASLDLLGALKFIAVFAVAVMVIGGIFRALFGKNSSLNHALSTSLGILCIYALTIVVYTFNPYELSRFLAPLPFVTFDGEVLHIFALQSADFPAICSQVLSMIILAFLVNLIDSLIPNGKRMLGWYVYRFLTVVLAMGLHYLVTWIFNAFLPGVLVAYAPMILLGTLVIMIALGLLKAILGLVLTVVNPLLGALYAFFFSNKIGKQLSKALLTSLVLCAVVYALNYFGFAVISISASALQAYVPLIAVLLVLWYLIGHVM